MFLEAIAAMLGHRRLDMTLHYAKIANRTVGPKMARLRREHHRLLGNGYCTRPAELDCAFESICENCTSSKPASNSGPPCKPNTTTPPATGNNSVATYSNDCSHRERKPSIMIHLTRITHIMPMSAYSSSMLSGTIMRTTWKETATWR